MEATSDEPGAAARINQPVRLERAVAVWCDYVNVMRHAEREVAHDSLVEHLDASFAVLLEQIIFQAASIELKGRHWRKLRGPKLEASGDVTIVTVGKVITKSEFFKMAGAQM